MTDLDDVAALRAADPGGMLDSVTGLPSQCRQGYAIGRGAPGLPSAHGVTSVAFCGMGGSAIAGDVIRALGAGRLRVPVSVVRSPVLPAFAGPDTLVVASSYSGNTAETLALFEAALERGCRLVALTSGGAVRRRADEAGVAVATIPDGFVPRAAFGYLALASLGMLEAIGLIPSLEPEVAEAIEELGAVIARSGPQVPSSENPAKALASRILGRTPVVWGGEGIAEVAALRWKAEINENAKTPAFSSALPELDHNEVEGWSGTHGERYAVIALRREGEHPEIAARFPLSMDVARSSGALVEEVWARGRSPLAQLLTLVLSGDLTSTYLAFARNVDPTEMETISRLKRALAGA